MRRLAYIVCGLTLVAAWGCEAGGGSSFKNDPISSSGSSGGGGNGGGLNFPVGGGGPGCDTSCSTDLHSVIDCNGVVLQECPPDQGCGDGGQCVPACDAAAQNASTFGCDFYSVTPAVISESRGSCYAVMVANTWTSDITVSASYNGTDINAAAHLYRPVDNAGTITYQPTGGTLAAGELGILFASKYASGDVFQINCPAGVTNALEQSTQLDGTGRSAAFQITTNRPIVAYDVYPWGGSSSFVTSATLLVPTPTWGDNFVTSDGWEAGFGNPWTQIVAAQDNTTVTMVPTANVLGGGGLAPIAANTAGTFTLNRGEVVQFLQSERLAGSALQSDKPISVWGGASCMNIPTGATFCDAAHQQLLPVQTLGNKYAAVRYPTRPGTADDNAPISLIGMVDGTTLTYDPAAPAGAPTSLARGQVAVFNSATPFEVHSQDEDHPFYAAAYMTGSSVGGGIGDPEYVNLVPPAQYLDYYLFVTDPTYRYTSLVFVRQKSGNDTFEDVTLDCAGTITGWIPLGSGGQYEYAQVKMVDNGAPLGSCQNGAHTANSTVPFGLTVWGYDTDVSYGYPAGMSVETINTVIVPPTPQ